GGARGVGDDLAGGGVGRGAVPPGADPARRGVPPRQAGDPSRGGAAVRGGAAAPLGVPAGLERNRARGRRGGGAAALGADRRFGRKGARKRVSGTSFALFRSVADAAARRVVIVRRNHATIRLDPIFQ